MPKFDGYLPVDDHNRIALPAELAARLGAAPGGRLAYYLSGSELRILRSADALARIYIEPTNACNLDCATCMRHVWDEPLGYMAPETFARILDGAAAFTPHPTLFFGGFGEPLAHPGILDMLAQAKALGGPVELITNGVLLDEPKSSGLIDSGLDMLWVSLDGATPESYADVRLGAELPLVLANLARLRALRDAAGQSRPQIGIAFVAMRRNLADLPALVRLGLSLGARRFSVSNVLAHTLELRGEVLYENSLYEDGRSNFRPVLDLPRLDVNGETAALLAQTLSLGVMAYLAGEPLNRNTNVCPFVEKASLSLRWDGALSPCLALLHSHTSYLDNHERRVSEYTLGNVNTRPLAELWLDPAYRALRAKLQAFDFSPCVTCNACEYAAANQEDCFSSGAPACGGCLWAQGLIQCP